MKICTKCKTLKTKEEFNKTSKVKSGLRSWCRNCEWLAYDEYKKRNYELECKRKRIWARSPLGVYNRIKYGKRKKPFNINKNDFLEWYISQPRKCSYCDIDESYLNKIKDKHNNKCINLSIDCMDNRKGYIMGNLCLSCLRCNYIKSDFFSFNEMRDIAQMFVKNKWLHEYRGKD